MTGSTFTIKGRTLANEKEGKKIESRKRNIGEYERSMRVVDIVYRDKKTTVYAIARELNSSDRQIRRDLQYVKDDYNIDTKAGRYGGVTWNENKYSDLDEPRKTVQENFDKGVGGGDSARFIRIMQELGYKSQESAYQILIRQIAYWQNGKVLLKNHVKKGEKKE